MAKKTGQSTKSKRKQKEKRASLFRFLFSRFFLKNLVLAGLILVLLVFVSVRMLSSYTQHNSYITVPDCRGISLEQVSEMLVDRSLDWNVADSVYDPREPPLTVLGQFPEATRHVKEGRVVHLTVNRLTPQMVEVPVEQVLEKTLRSVQFKLQGKGFMIGELIYKPGVYDNQVLELRRGGTDKVLEAGAMLPKGAVVDLVVTDGFGNTRIAMPEFRGRSYTEAEFLLKANNLVEGRISFGPEVTAEDSITFVVLRQQPESGEGVYIKEGSTVDLWFGSMDDYLESENPELEIRSLSEEIQEVEQ